MFGLSWLLETLDPERSAKLRESAYAKEDIGESLYYIATDYKNTDAERAKKLYKDAAEHGSNKAKQALAELEEQEGAFF